MSQKQHFDLILVRMLSRIQERLDLKQPESIPKLIEGINKIRKSGEHKRGKQNKARELRKSNI